MLEVRKGKKAARGTNELIVGKKRERRRNDHIVTRVVPTSISVRGREGYRTVQNVRVVV